MLGLVRKTTQTDERVMAVQSKVAAFLYAQFSAEDGPLGTLDRFTQRRLSDSNISKVVDVLQAGDPVERCYQNLVREIEAEAEFGVRLATPTAHLAVLRQICAESGISGQLGQHVPAEQIDFDRAYVDAKVSEIVLGHLFGDSDAALDVTDALRSLLYAFHEHQLRQSNELPLLLDDRATRDLVTMVAELRQRVEESRDLTNTPDS